MKATLVWPDGRMWVYHVTIENDSDGSGTITSEIVPGAGSEMEVLYGSITNGDVAGRPGRVEIEDDDDNLIARILTETVGAAGVISFPGADAPAANSGVSAGAPILVVGDMVFIMRMESVAVSQDVTFAVVARIRGGPPTATETAQGTTPVITINTEKTF